MNKKLVEKGQKYIYKQNTKAWIDAFNINTKKIMAQAVKIMEMLDTTAALKDIFDLLKAGGLTKEEMLEVNLIILKFAKRGPEYFREWYEVNEFSIYNKMVERIEKRNKLWNLDSKEEPEMFM